MKPVYITHAKRTAIGSLLGALGQIAAPKLGETVIKSILNESNVDANLIDEVILGQVLTGGAGQNPARQASINAGLPNEVSAFTINKVCGSGLKAVCLAAESIMLGNSNLVLAGGQESMSMALHGSYIRAGTKFGDAKLLDLMLYDGLIDIFSGRLMGITAENVAKAFNITREMQDDFAMNSQKKAAKAISEGIFKDEIVPVEIVQKKQVILFDQDEGVRSDTSLEILAKLKPAFDTAGTVTAGNSSTINDGAACLMLASEEMVKQYNLPILARIVSFASAGVDHSIMGIGPVPASKKALSMAGWKAEDLELVECNEAFAASSVYVNQQMGWDINKVNVNGGAIALGHPIGASGARVLVTLTHQMQKQKARKGLASLCIGGGLGIAICVENS